MGKDLFNQLYNANKIVQSRLADELNQISLSYREYTILKAIHANTQLTPILAQMLNLKKSTLSRQLNQLQKKNLLTLQGFTDRHEKKFKLTTLGLERLTKAEIFQKTLYHDYFNHWSDTELRMLQILLERLITEN
ncbi:MarR family winged helix-turn-helix transcriptional regulator [Agrilactobacillus fermenti]|uniref:MarR family winged helix-turn-helix transcriptional regulator n=1 Tax=Agrilactobacillus fermenti TaxID=2586909 RepID=UPI001E30D2DF|nr:hypothetical protein [Agrilactobacillus fermenti]MCD2256577.1 hypothetical protein [Agrilactobacillus fermenti]